MRRAARIVAVALAAFLVVLLALPASALAGEKPKLSDVKINGTTYYNTSDLPTGLSWDESSGVLTLNNYTGESIDMNKNGAYDMTIRLVGTNTLTRSTPITSSEDKSFSVITNYYESDGRDAQRSIKFIGSGTLTINGTQSNRDYCVRGIYAGGNVVFAGSCTVNVNVRHTASSASTTYYYGVWGVRSEEGNVIVQDSASLNVTCGTTATNNPRGACLYFASNAGHLHVSSSKSVYLDGSGAGPQLDGIYTTAERPLTMEANGWNQTVTIKSGRPFQSSRDYRGAAGNVDGFYRFYDGSGATTFVRWQRRRPITSYFTEPPDVTYAGSERKLAPTFSSGPKQGTDYTISWPDSDYTNVGIKTVVVSCTNADTSPYGGTATIHYEIVPANISSAVIDEMLPAHLVGGVAEPKPTITFNGKKLKEGTDYTLSYAENTYVTLNAQVIATGKGNFTGSKKAYFSIVKGAAVPIYRMYNTKTSEHLYTTNAKEYGMCGTGNYVDWNAEGVAWIAPGKDDYGATPVYRLYNMKSGDHHYTTSKGERDKLLAGGDWRDEGIAFHSADKANPGNIPVYRVYNGRLKRGQHHYTTSAGERDALVNAHGWRDEGIGFYGYKQ